MAEGPEPVRLDPDKPDVSFHRGTSGPGQLTEAQQKLSTKYPQLNAILTAEPTISVQKLADAIGVSKGTAFNIKKQWGLPSNPPSVPVATQTTNAVKEVAQSIKETLVGKGNTLSPSEAKEIAEPFTAALESDFQALDQYLWARQRAVGKDTDNQPIWSDLDDQEIGKLSKVMLRWGQRNATAATVVRGVTESADYIAVGAIFIPRIKRTVEVMRETRIPPKRRGQAIYENKN